MQIEIKCEFDEQSKAVTAKAGIKLIVEPEELTTLDDLVLLRERVRKESTILFDEAFVESRNFSMRKA